MFRVLSIYNFESILDLLYKNGFADPIFPTLSANFSIIFRGPYLIPDFTYDELMFFQKTMCCSAHVRTRKKQKNAKNWKKRINATRRRYGVSVWRLVNDAQVVQEIKFLIPTILINVFAQETSSLTPIIQINVYAQETKFQTTPIPVNVFALLIRFLITITSVCVITVSYPTWPGNAVNILFFSYDLQ